MRTRRLSTRAPRAASSLQARATGDRGRRRRNACADDAGRRGSYPSATRIERQDRRRFDRHRQHDAACEAGSAAIRRSALERMRMALDAEPHRRSGTGTSSPARCISTRACARSGGCPTTPRTASRFSAMRCIRTTIARTREAVGLALDPGHARRLRDGISRHRRDRRRRALDRGARPHLLRGRARGAHHRHGARHHRAQAARAACACAAARTRASLQKSARRRAGDGARRRRRARRRWRIFSANSPRGCRRSSMAHDLLVSQEWRGASMHELVRAQMAYCLDVGLRRNTRTSTGRDLMLKPEAAQNIGLALHELAVNALTHGALSQPDGRIELDWRVDDDQFFVEWREFGGPALDSRRERLRPQGDQAPRRAGARRRGDDRLSAGRAGAGRCRSRELRNDSRIEFAQRESTLAHRSRRAERLRDPLRILSGVDHGERRDGVVESLPLPI